MHFTRSHIKNWRDLGLWACAIWLHSRQSVVGRWVRRLRQCKKSAKNGCSVTIRLDRPVTGIFCKQILLLQNKSWLLVLPSIFSNPTLLFRQYVACVFVKLSWNKWRNRNSMATVCSLSICALEMHMHIYVSSEIPDCSTDARYGAFCAINIFCWRLIYCLINSDSSASGEINVC